MSRISSIVLDKHQRPRRAVIRTPFGSVKVGWRDHAGQWVWSSTGDLAARQLAVPHIERIQRMATTT